MPKSDRIAVLSDIHGNLPALEAVVSDALRRGCSRFINLGDILSGPLWPRETAEYLMSENWLTISGNHERQILSGRSPQMGLSDWFARARLTERHLDWLRSLPETYKLGSVFLCHGTPTSDIEYFLETVTERGVRPASADEVIERTGRRSEPVVLCGHTHAPRIVELGTRTVANPGSVGLQAYEGSSPHYHAIEVGSPHARYGMLQGENFELLEVEYDWSAAARRARANGREDWVEPLKSGFVRPPANRLVERG